MQTVLCAAVKALPDCFVDTAQFYCLLGTCH